MSTPIVLDDSEVVESPTKKVVKDTSTKEIVIGIDNLMHSKYMDKKDNVR